MGVSRRKIVNGFIWRLMQNVGNQVVSFIISIILARLLMPEDYGLVAMITIFTNIAMVFINTGFSSAIIQKKVLTDEDIDTIFFTGVLCGILLYGILYLIAPTVSNFYAEPQLTKLFRAESLIVIIASLSSVQQALITRALLFKKNFFIGLTATLLQGVIGISLALLGYGVWALVISSLVNGAVSAVLSWKVVSWRPKFLFSVQSFASMFSFSINMLVSGLLTAIYNNIRSLIIGKQYSSSALAYYNKGNQFPTLIMTQIDGSMATVMFSSLAKFQDDWEQGLAVMRRALKVSMYVCVPMMAGLIAVAEPMVKILLTEKWLPCVEYLQLMAVICMTWPLSVRGHALKSLGRSDVALKLNAVSIVSSLVSIVLTYKISVRMMVYGSMVAIAVTQVIEAIVYNKYLQYRIRDLFADILPTVLMSAIMCAACLAFKHFAVLPAFLILVGEILIGTAIYIILSIITKNDNFLYIFNFLKHMVLHRFGTNN